MSQHLQNKSKNGKSVITRTIHAYDKNANSMTGNNSIVNSGQISNICEYDSYMNRMMFILGNLNKINISDENKHEVSNKLKMNPADDGNQDRDNIVYLHDVIETKSLESNVNTGMRPRNRVIAVKNNPLADRFYKISQIGLQNPQAYCYLNSIVQVLFAHRTFAYKMIEYYCRNGTSTVINEGESFTSELGQLFYHLSNKNRQINSVQDSVGRFQAYFENSERGEDIHNCYLQLLSKINSEVKVPTNNTTLSKRDVSDVAERKYLEFKSKNNGFIFDLFCGQISYRTACQSCFEQINENFQLFKSIPLRIELSPEKISIQMCIQRFFEKSHIVDGEFSCCDTPDVFIVPKITHAPKFIFIYLARGTFNNYEYKNNTFIEFGQHIIIPTTKQTILYKLRSVIDHIGSIDGGHYFSKTYSDSSWWLQNDNHVRQISWPQVVTKDSIGLFLEIGTFDGTVFSGIVPKQPNCAQWIIIMLLSCVEFKESLLDLVSPMEVVTECDIEELFIRKLRQIIRYVEQHEINKGRDVMDSIPRLFEDTLKMDSIHKCYLKIFTIIFHVASDLWEKRLNYEIFKNEKESKNFEEKSKSFYNLFTGQLNYRSKCQSCDEVYFDNFHIFRSIPIQLSTEGSLQDHIKLYFEESKIDRMCDDCGEYSILNFQDIINAPKYLFIALFHEEKYFPTSFDMHVEIPTRNGAVLYEIHSVIERFRSNNLQKYIFKYFINDSWWQNDGVEMKQIPWAEVPTKYCIGLFMEIVPTQCLVKKFQVNDGFNSIIQMLYLCSDFRKMLIESDPVEQNQPKVPEENLFMKSLTDVMYHLQKEDTVKAQQLMKDLQSHFLKSPQTDINSLYIAILAKIKMKKEYFNTESSQISYSNVGSSTDDYFDEQDLFAGKLLEESKCENCETSFNSEFQSFPCFDIPFIKDGESLQNYLEGYFQKRKFPNKIHNYKCCLRQSCVVITEIHRAPKYLFFYLLKENSSKTSLVLETEIILQTLLGNKFYSLLSVINCVDKEDRFEFDNSYQVSHFQSNNNLVKNVLTKNVIGFMMELKESSTNVSARTHETLESFASNMDNMGRDRNSPLSVIEDEINVNCNLQSNYNTNSKQIISNDKFVNDCPMDTNSLPQHSPDKQIQYHNDMDPSPSRITDVNKIDISPVDFEDLPLSNVEDKNTIKLSELDGVDANKMDISLQNMRVSKIDIPFPNKNSLPTNSHRNLTLRGENVGNHSSSHLSPQNLNSIPMNTNRNNSTSTEGISEIEGIHTIKKVKDLSDGQHNTNEEELLMRSVEILFSEDLNEKAFVSLIGILFICTPFRDRILQYHVNGMIAMLDTEELDIQNVFFFNDICRLFAFMVEKNKSKIQDLIKIFEQRRLNISAKFDLLKCLSSVLEKINSVITHFQKKYYAENKKTHQQNIDSNFPRLDFNCDFFNGEMLTTVFCNSCHGISKTECQQINGISVETVKNIDAEPINLRDCIDNFFLKSSCELLNNPCRKCGAHRMESRQQITWAPEYFFIYLRRFPNYINSHNGISVTDVTIIENDRPISYSPIAILERRKLGENLYHNSMKMYTNRWCEIHAESRNVPMNKPTDIVEVKFVIMLKKH